MVDFLANIIIRSIKEVSLGYKKTLTDIYCHSVGRGLQASTGGAKKVAQPCITRRRAAMLLTIIKSAFYDFISREVGCAGRRARKQNFRITFKNVFGRPKVLQIQVTPINESVRGARWQWLLRTKGCTEKERKKLTKDRRGRCGGTLYECQGLIYYADMAWIFRQKRIIAYKRLKREENWQFPRFENRNAFPLVGAGRRRERVLPDGRKISRRVSDDF